MRIAGAVISVLVLAACGWLFPPTPDRSGQVQMPWVLSADSGNRLELAVMVAGADCERFVGVDLLESDQSVEVQAWVEESRTDACFLVRGYRPVTVDLSSPLGDRTLNGCMIEESAPHDTRETCDEIVEL